MESKKKRIMVFGVMLTAVLLVIGGTTYAFFFTNGFGQTKNETVTMTSGTLALTFSDKDGAGAKIEKVLSFGDTIEKELKIENTGTLDAYAKISWDNLVNTYLPQSLSYTLQYKTSIDGEYQEAKTSRRNVPTSESSNRVLADSLLIPAGETYYYLLTIKLENLKTIDQTQDLKATFRTKFILGEGKIPSTSVMVAKESYTSNEKIWAHKADIKKVVFEDRLNPKMNATYTYDISESQDESVMSYLIPTEEDNTKYSLYIQGEHGVVANRNSSNLFNGFTNLESIEGLEFLDTSNVTNMNFMFQRCDNLTSLDVSNFDTKNVKNMNHMFYGCSSLTTLDVNNFDTSNVTDIGDMFSSCSNLTSLDVSNFDTSKVIDMNNMFNNCRNLTSLDLNNFDTKNVKNMNHMFYECRSLTSLDLRNFDTSNVNDMRSMFYGCSSLISLDISSFDTSKVTNMSYIFRECSKLTSLDVSNFDTTNVTDMRQMFLACRNLTSLDVSNFNTSSVTDMSYMFESCSKLTLLDVSNFDTNNVTSMFQMFLGCSSLTSLDVSVFDTSKVTTMGSMFSNCSNLTLLNISGFNISNVTNSESMFWSISSSIKITVHNDELKQWVIDSSSNPKLTEANITVV